ncbi:hypothetical protein NUACC26_006480 [Scytonema sp. NUACC26]
MGTGELGAPSLLRGNGDWELEISIPLRVRSPLRRETLLQGCLTNRQSPIANPFAIHHDRDL